MAMLHAIDEASHVEISIFPQKYAIRIFRLVINKLADIDIPIDVLEPIAMFTIILKLSLIKPPHAPALSPIPGPVPRTLIDKQPIPMKHLITSHPKIPRIVSLRHILRIFNSLLDIRVGPVPD